jgi:hypothetical protein
MAIVEANDFGAETHRKSQNLNPAPASDQEVPKLMKEDDDT